LELYISLQGLFGAWKNGDVDVFDLVVIALSYGSQEGGLAGQSNFDLNDHGKLGIFDVVIVATNYGKTW